MFFPRFRVPSIATSNSEGQCSLKPDIKEVKNLLLDVKNKLKYLKAPDKSQGTYYVMFEYYG